MLKSTHKLEFDKNTKLFYKLLLEEDYNFKNKDIKINIKMSNNKEIEVEISSSNIMDLKIANYSFIKSLEIIKKTLEI